MIFWKYLKGLNELIENEATQQLFTYFIFSNKKYQINNIDQEYLPTIHINSQNSFGSSTDLDLGYVITSKAVNQYIHKDIRFRETKTDGTPENRTEGSISIFFKDDTTWISDIYTNSRDSFEFFSHKRVVVSSLEEVNLATKYNDDWHKTLKIVDNQITIGESGVDNGANLAINGSCSAAYFNATSDRRAKTNIKPLSINALELVNKTPLYSFKYKDSDLPSIGIIAQDVQNIDIEGFKLVDNEQASGKDYDYMSIHESKLTYILWKAVQEQQALIKDLQAQINELKKN